MTLPKTGTSFEDASDVSLIRDVLGEISHGYVEKVDRDKLINGAIDGMVKTLDDPYTRHLKKSDYSSFQEQTAGHFGGVGIELGIREDKLTVIAPIKDTPADRAGVQAGDLIEKINKTSTTGMPIGKAVKLIRGPEGSKVTLWFIRNGGKPFSKELTRAAIKLPNVSGRLIDKTFGFIRVHAFNENSAKDIRQELDDLKAKGAKGVIIDLRNNPGGLLNEAVQVSSIFIKSGPIVRVKSRDGKTDTLSASDNADDKTPLVVLVSRGSASASEIFAAAVQDRNRGIIIGEKTFGKASVQTVVPLPDGSGLVMTTAKYLTPKNRSLNKRGVTPDITVKMKKKNWD